MVDRSEELNKLALKAQAAYVRKWRKRNPEKVREINKRYWIKKASELETEDSK